jgi:hypothetical protein
VAWRDRGMGGEASRLVSLRVLAGEGESRFGGLSDRVCMTGLCNFGLLGSSKKFRCGEQMR